MPSQTAAGPDSDWPGKLNKFIPKSHTRLTLIAACVISLLASVWLVIVLPQSTDLWFYKHWSRLVTLNGISAAYSGVPAETYVDYPPVLLYAWKAEGHLYQRLADPSFEKSTMLHSEAHIFGLSMIAVLFHLATGLALYALTRRSLAAPGAVTVAVLYLLNPAILYNTAGLGLLDSVHSFWLVLTFGLAAAGLTRSGWMMAAFAALTKPQAWGLMPLFAWQRFWGDGFRKTLVGLAVAAAAAAIIVMPFILHGTIGKLASLPSHMAQVQPLISAQAHNLWWVLSLGDGLKIRDDKPLLGPATYHHIALLLLITSGFFTLWVSRRAASHISIQLPAFQMFAWFCLTTRAHENHWFSALPLAALALPSDRRMMGIFTTISVTGLLNLVLHDKYLLSHQLSAIPDMAIWNAQMLNSTANLIILGVWVTSLIRAAKAGATPAPSATR